MTHEHAPDERLDDAALAYAATLQDHRDVTRAWAQAGFPADGYDEALASLARLIAARQRLRAAVAELEDAELSTDPVLFGFEPSAVPVDRERWV